MRLDENWAVDPGRAAEFFRAMPGALETEAGFRVDGCAVTLIPVEGLAMGRWALPRVRLVLEGEEADVRSLHRRFFLRFLSAGG